MQVRRKQSRLVGTMTIFALALALLVGAGLTDGAVFGAPRSDPPPPALVAQVPNMLAAPQAPGTSTGVVYGSAFYLALVIQNDDVLAYLCDGDTIGEWFGARLNAGRFDVVTDSGLRVSGARDGAGASGTVTVPGVGPLPFETWPSVSGTTGLLRSVEGEGAAREVTGLILVDGGGLRGLSKPGNGPATNPVAVPRTLNENTSEGAGGGGLTGSGGGATGGGGGGELCGPICKRKTRLAGTPGTGGAAAGCVNIITNGCSFSCSQLSNALNNLQIAINSVASNIAASNSNKPAKEVNTLIQGAIAGLQAEAHDIRNQMSANGCNG